ncbi:MAG: cyclopropane-fatty-acyl-phospholipid synthase family protein [Pseudomonadota bacterium]
MLAHLLFSAIIKEGDLTVIDAQRRSREYGDKTGPAITICLQDRTLELGLFINPKLVFGEAYTDGRMTVEKGSLYELLELCIKNLEKLEGHPFWSIFQRASNLLRHLKSFNPISRARRNVAHHYDLSGELYDLFLDKDRQYSCAYFDDPDQELEAAQSDKKRHLASKMLLDTADLEILDIGSGWGGLGMYLAQESGARVKGLTLSSEQHGLSNQRAEAAGLGDRVKFELKDYRLETDSFNRIISVGMFEHVGSSHYREFFRKIKELLTDDGVMVLHSIGRSEPPGGMNPWIVKYIFPGGYIPALSEVFAAIEKEGLYVTDVEVLRYHYAETLRNWRLRFYANRDKVAELYDERFCRMWDFYLSSCELTFRFAGQMVFQIQLSKKQDAVPLKRDYMVDWERRRQPQRSTQAAE